MAKFPSAEWAELLEAAVNANGEYAEAAEAWEGDVLLRVVLDPPSTPPPGIALDLAHGTCRSARYHADSRETSTEFVFEATPAIWREILEGRLEPVKSVVSGKLRVRGNLAKVMRFTRASGLLIATAATIPTEF
ncbi:MAG TPA: SCP2 sterol-binding domain-containing protein [Thermoplasmata archaeon]|jgi:putative sterol carrier protein|nr:SCP2 sterol-binding domain-containing protein [Thermoplasmata archaeon]